MAADIDVRSGWTLTGVSTANAQVTGTQAAPGAGLSLYLTSFTVTMSGGTLAVAMTVVSGAVTLTYYLAASAAGSPDVPLHICFAVPVKMPTNTSVVVTVPALGGATIGSFVLTGILGP